MAALCLRAQLPLAGATVPAAGSTAPAFYHLTVENGLSQNAVLSLGQDDRGFMWIGTSNGLNRYDGYRFRVYQSRSDDSSSLSNNNIISILIDSRQRMWVGTYAGLNQYHPKKDEFSHVPLPAGNNVPFHCLYEDRQGTVWVGSGEGLYTLEADGNQALLKPYALPTEGTVSKKPDVRAVMEDRNGNLWVGTTTGLVLMRNNSVHPSFAVFRHDPAQPGSLTADFVTTVAEDRQGKIWVGTLNSGVNVLDISSGQFQHLQSGRELVHNNIRKILITRSGLIWVGTQEGISLLREDLQPAQQLQQSDQNPESLSQNSIHALYEDVAGNIWAGTYFGGVNYTYAINTEFHVLRKKDQPQYLNNNVISSMVEDGQQNIWIGTEGGGLNYYDHKSGLFTIYKYDAQNPHSIGSNLIKVVYKDWQGQIWAGTHGGGLNLFDPASKKFRRYLYKENDPSSLNSEILSIYEDSKGRFWVGSTQGIQLFNKTQNGLDSASVRFQNAGVMKATAYYFLEDEKRRLWISTSEGLYVLERDAFRKITDDVVNSIHQDRQFRIWLGMRKGGLARYQEETGQLDMFNQPGKIGTRNIMGILEDNMGNLWLSSDNGLIRYNPQQDQAQVFSVSDGLAGKSFNYNSFLKDSHGQFYFGGFNGITYFLPEEIQSNQKAANIVFTDLRLFNEPVEPGGSGDVLKNSIAFTDGLTLRYNQDVVSFEFALLNYIKSNKNSFAYKLEGYDNDWIYTSVPRASYTNLPTGSFTFLVKGANNDGVWSSTIRMSVTILPPFWLTWWAYIIYILAAAGIVFLVVRYFFLGALLKKEEELHQVKLNFFTNISHEIRTHLTLIMAPVDKMLESDQTGHFVKQQLHGVKHNANRLLKLVSELMDFRKAETNNLKLSVGKQDLVAFLEDIYNSFRDVSIRKNISFSFLHNRESLPLYFDKEQLEKVFFNLLANAVRFTPENGSVLVEIIEQDKTVVINVVDNGRGIAAEHLDKIFTNFFQVADHGVQNTGYGIGLALAKTIVTLHHGDISAESVPATTTSEGRTTFRVMLLKGKDHFTEVELRDGDRAAESRQPLTLPVHAEPAHPLEEVEAGPRQQTLLVVEDHAELRQMIREIFEGRFTILEAADGKQGLEMAQAEIPDLIISDIMMPEMDGLELCRILKTDSRSSHIPVILLTARSTQNDKISGLEEGADLYITKPFSAKVLDLSARNLMTARERLREKVKQQLSSIKGPSDVFNEKKELLNQLDKQYLEDVVAYVEENLDNPDFGVDMLSRHLAMSVPVMYKKIKALTKMSVNDFIKSIRLRRAAELLQEQRLNVNEIAMEVGFKDRRYFSQEFRKQYGKTPREFRPNDEG